jgi:hypothetical protein
VAAQRPGWLVKAAQPPYDCPRSRIFKTTPSLRALLFQTVHYSNRIANQQNLK